MTSFLNFGTGLGVAEQAVSLLIPKRKVRLGEGVTGEFLPFGAIELDASVEELHESSAEIPRHPVEEGADIGDHVRRKPDTLRITGIVTNTPIILGAALRVSFTRAEEFEDTLRTIKNAGLRITIITTLRQYDNMLLKNYQVPRNAGLGNTVEATMFFEEVILVKTETIAATPVDPANVAVGAKGKIAAPPTASPATEAQSQSAGIKIAKVAEKFISGLLGGGN